MFLSCLIDMAVALPGGAGKRTLPNEKNFFGVKNLKTLKGGSIFVSVNSEPTVA